MDTLKKSEDLQQKILDLVSEYYVETNKAQEFHKGITPIPYAGRVFDEKDMQNGVRSVLEFWLTAGHFSEEIEKKFRKLFNSNAAYLVNYWFFSKPTYGIYSMQSSNKQSTDPWR